MKKLTYLLILFLSFLSYNTAFADYELEFNRGLASYMQAEYNQAVEHLEKALQEKPDDPKANHLAGLAHFRLNQFEDAVVYLEKAKSADPGITNINLDLGASYMKTGNYEKAIRILGEHIATNPDSGVAYYYLGYSHFALGEYKTAIDSFENASRLNSDFTMQSSYYRGVSYYLMSDYENARSSFEKVISLAPDGRLGKSSEDYLRIINRLFKKYYANFTFGYQYDSNVALEPEDIKIVSDESDSSIFLYLNLGYKPYFTDDAVIGLDYRTFFSFHDELEEFNVQNHKFSIYGERDLDSGPKPMRLFLNYSYELVFIDGNPADELFSQSHSIIPGLTIKWSDRASSRIFYEFRYDDFDDFPERDAFNNSLTIAQFYRYLNGRLLISPGVGFELNTADDITNERNYSYWSPKAYIEALASLPHQTTLYSKVHYNYEDYYDDSFDRTDNQFGFKALVSKGIYKYVFLDVAYEFIYNDSSSDFPGPEPFNYNRNIITVGFSLRL